MPILIGIPLYYEGILPSDQKIQIHSLVSEFNIVEAVLRKISLDFLNELSLRGLALYLEWILALSKVCPCPST